MSGPMSVSVSDLVDQGVLVVSDGYRTKQSEHGRPGYRIVRVADVLDDDVHLTGPDFVSRDYRKQIGSKLGQAGDVLLTTKGTVGRVAIMPETTELVVYSPQLCYFRVVDKAVIDPRYLRYWFSTPNFWAQAADRMNNTDMAAYINLADIGSLTLELPPINDQRAISEVLGSLDDKIAANNRLIGLLIQHQSGEYEAALQRGQQSRRVDDVAIFHNRKRIPLSARERNERPGLIPYYGATGVFDTVDEPLFDDRLVLVGEDGSVITDEGLPVIQYIWGPSWINNHAHVLTGRSVSTELLRFALARTNVAALVTGAVQPKVSMGKLKDLTLDLPLSEDLPQLEQTVASEMALLRASSEESRTLSIMRDELLPQLMSGRIRVRDAEQMVGNGA